MDVKSFLRVAAVGVLLIISFLILVASARAKSNLWMLEISENTAATYNQLCAVDGEHLYSLAGWVPAPMHRDKLIAAGVEVEDYATIYEQKNYEVLVARSDAPIPVVTDDADLRHYWFAGESVVSFRKAAYAGIEDGRRTFFIDANFEQVFNASVGPEGYGVYDLSTLEDGLYYVNPGGLVELKRSSE